MADRRADLVRAAFTCVAERGFEGLRLRAVAVEVGIDHSTLHHYFPTKEDLVAAVVEHATRQFWDTMPAGDDARSRLHGHLATLGRMIGEQPALFTVLTELDLRAQRDPAVAALMERYVTGWRVALGDVLRLGVEQGAWSFGDDATVELVIAVVKGVRLRPDLAEAVLAQLERLITS
jgi:AcrR family transcriptional regulator